MSANTAAHGPIRKALGLECCRERQANEDITSARIERMFESDTMAQSPALEITALSCCTICYNVVRIFYVVFVTRQ